ncbi:LysE family transporter [Paraburkholderia pallida]|uniref:Threonine transporter n=1 Tax=Paraburkholderia pallida TaxID=2547399 RepID=A0A4P7D686_9BURK|nr:LysE family transporter [Paraburkholderia pallida]QBR02132.1 threonine transporter [Paraburkholderia pallida]
MHESTLLAILAVVYLPVILSPGQNFLAVSHCAMNESRLSGISAALGVACGSATWAIVTTTGLAFLVESMGWLKTGLQIFGSLYLINLGLTIWRQAKVPMPAAMDFSDRPNLYESFKFGLTTNLTNPKALVFNTSMFSALLTPEVSPLTRAACVFLIFALSASWHLSLACMFSLRHVRQGYVKAKVWIGRGTGAILLLFGFSTLAELARQL